MSWGWPAGIDSTNESLRVAPTRRPPAATPTLNIVVTELDCRGTPWWNVQKAVVVPCKTQQQLVRRMHSRRSAPRWRHAGARTCVAKRGQHHLNQTSHQMNMLGGIGYVMGALSLTLLLSEVLWWGTNRMYSRPSAERRKPLPRQPTTLQPPIGQLAGQWSGWHRFANHSGLRGVRCPIQQQSMTALPQAFAADTTAGWSGWLSSKPSSGK